MHLLHDRYELYIIYTIYTSSDCAYLFIISSKFIKIIIRIVYPLEFSGRKAINRQHYTMNVLNVFIYKIDRKAG